MSKWVFYDKSSGPHISQPYKSMGLARASKSLFLVTIADESMLESKLLSRTLVAFLLRISLARMCDVQMMTFLSLDMFVCRQFLKFHFRI